jgi:hypothetical protein
MTIAAAVLAAVALAWRSTFPTEVNAIVTRVHCSWAPLRLGDIVVTGTAYNPSSRTRDFTLTLHLGLPGLADQSSDGGSFAAPADGPYHFWADVATSRHSHPGGPITGCGASARSFTPSGHD